MSVQDSTNPEAPPELLEQPEEIIHGDNIGGTMFSKHWLFTTLMKLIQVVDGPREREGDREDAEPDSDQSPINLDDQLQDQLCELWDMSMNTEVAVFLQEFKAIEILSGVIARSRAPRATEISVGILGNMACCKSVAPDISSNTKLVELVLDMLGNPDAPTLIETTRLIITSLSRKETRVPWLEEMKKGNSVYDHVKFILQSSTNNDLLNNTFQLLDAAMDADEQLCASWSTQDMLQALFEAWKQFGVHLGPALDTIVHIFQLVSTAETGVAALVTESDHVMELMGRYLDLLCEDEVLVLEGRENTVTSVLSVIRVVCHSCNKSQSKLTEEADLIRCVLKILVAVYRKLFVTKYCGLKRMRTNSEKRKSFEQDSCGVDKEKVEASSSSLSEKPVQTSEESDKKVSGGEKSTSLSDSSKQGTEKSEVLLDTEEKSLYTLLHDTIQSFLQEYVELVHKESDEEEKPESLRYLDHCQRERVHCMVDTLQSASSQSKDYVGLLSKVARRYHLKRLQAIIHEASEKD